MGSVGFGWVQLNRTDAKRAHWQALGGCKDLREEERAGSVQQRRNVWRKLLLLVLLRVVRLLLLLVVRLVVAVAVAVALSTRAHTALSLAGSTCRRASVPRLCCRRRLYYVQS